jgi:hypothetical protein
VAQPAFRCRRASSQRSRGSDQRNVDTDACQAFGGCELFDGLRKDVQECVRMIGVKLSELAREQGVPYRSALIWLHAGTVPVPARQLPTGTMLVDSPDQSGGGVLVRTRPDSRTPTWRLRSHCGAQRFAFNWGLALVKANLEQRRGREVLRHSRCRVDAVVVGLRPAENLEPGQGHDRAVAGGEPEGGVLVCAGATSESPLSTFRRPQPDCVWRTPAAGTAQPCPRGACGNRERPDGTSVRTGHQ